MRLKRVRIFGFKTFADRTDVNLEGGIVAVVGPNGCGKSNLVDAILWGLGEGNARQLRAQSSQDVIFSGSAQRKPVGFTEVSLLFDNEDGGLPIDTPEVSITRRLNRAGDSEYSINKRSCRLRDVHDLLADSGLGRSGYSIVGQKEIDQALAASPEERRAWVDEAAGVQRYRSRKVESQRRLVAAEQHLQRVTDILNELEAQREPLREEAEIAARYKSLLGALREVESGLLIKEVANAVQEMCDLDKRIADSVRLGREETDRAARLENTARSLEGKVAEVEAEIETVHRRIQENLSAVERAQAEIRLCEERRKSLKELEQSLGSADGGARIAQAQAEVTGLEGEVAVERGALDKLGQEAAGAGAVAAELTQSLRRIEARLIEARAQQAERLKVEADLAHRKERTREVKRELLGIKQGSPEMEAAVGAAKGELQALETKVKESRERIKVLEGDLQKLRQDEDRDAQEHRKALSDRSVLEGRMRGIEATIDAHEGLNQGARAVLEAKDRGFLTASYVPVGEAIEVAPQYAQALDVALGGAANDLIVEKEGDAKAAIAFLKENRLGRATFQPITLMRPSDVSMELRRLLTSKGIIGRASELVSCRAAHRPVIDSLLGRVLVVEDLDSALQYAKTAGWNRMVTLEGEVVHSSGAVTGGAAAKQSFGLVQRKAELARLGDELGNLAERLAEADQRSRNRAKSRAAIELSIQEHRHAVEEVGGDLQDARNYFQALQDEWNGMERSQQRLESEMAKLLSEAPTLLDPVDVGEIEAERDGVLKQLAAGSADAEQAEARLREADQRVSQAESRLAAGRRRLETVVEDEANRERRLAHVGPEDARLAAEIERQGQRLTQAEQEKTAAGTRLESLAASREALNLERREAGEQARMARENVSAMGDASHQAELTRARVDARRASSAARLLEEYGVDEEVAIQRSSGIELPPDAASVTGRLRRELKGMGDVNLGAIEAFERLTERFDELDAQRSDVRGGIEQIHAGILELDKLTRERFMDTFARLQLEFASLVTRLFGGGEGALSLTKADSILDTGLDIEVQLPGKKRQRLELLSGGERALCATAFLFGLLKIKPSPLVVLDEVDAPLDGRNVERFSEILVEFSQQMQFIVITHNPTTIQAAPIWLGVTMQEPGVSTLAPVRLPQSPAAKPA